MASNRGFTLIEIVLAIGITGAVLALLTSAIEIYLLRVDTGRAQAESAQLARTLLDLIAEDIRASRYAGSANSSSSANSSGSTGFSDSSIENTLGINGDELELTITRSSKWDWQRLTRDLQDPEMTYADELPKQIRYFLGEGKELLTNQQAALAIGTEISPQQYAGLFREQNITSFNTSLASFGSSSLEAPKLELLAPEVVDISFGYFDGETLLDVWDSSVNEGLPVGIEIRLTLLTVESDSATQEAKKDRTELRKNEDNLKEYRMFVALPQIEASSEPSIF